MRRTLFIATALGERGIGLLLLVSPAVPIKLLHGKVQDSQEMAVAARIAGAALVALGVACWFGCNDRDSAAQKGLLLGLLLYDLAAAGILACSGLFLGLAGVALRPAVGSHFALAVCCVACIRGPIR